MKRARLAVIVALIATLGMFAIADALAQFGGGMPGGGRMRKGGGPARERPAAQEQQGVGDLVAFRLALLQEDLKLTREQERAWTAYEERANALAADIAREQNRMRSPMSLNAMQQVNHAVDTARNRLTAWEEIAAAAKALYDGLTPQQKELADARFPSIVSALTAGGTIIAGSRSDETGNRWGGGPPPGAEARYRQ